jgi:hypothetical protein
MPKNADAVSSQALRIAPSDEELLAGAAFQMGLMF